MEKRKTSAANIRSYCMPQKAICISTSATNKHFARRQNCINQSGTQHSAARWLQMFGKTICKKIKPEKGIGTVWEFGNRKLKVESLKNLNSKPNCFLETIHRLENWPFFENKPEIGFIAELVSGKQFSELKTGLSLKIKPKLDFYPKNFPQTYFVVCGLERLWNCCPRLKKYC